MRKIIIDIIPFKAVFIFIQNLNSNYYRTLTVRLAGAEMGPVTQRTSNWPINVKTGVSNEIIFKIFFLKKHVLKSLFCLAVIYMIVSIWSQDNVKIISIKLFLGCFFSIFFWRFGISVRFCGLCYKNWPIW